MIKSKPYKTLLLYILFTIYSSLSAQELIDSVSLTVGSSMDNEKIYKLGVQKNFNSILYENSSGYLSGFYDLSINRWNCDGDSVNAIAFSPVFTYSLNSPVLNTTPYLFFGVGAAYISPVETDKKDFSSHFQFEDRIGIGFKADSYELNIGYFHYSNGDIKEPNDGIDIIGLTYLYYL